MGLFYISCDCIFVAVELNTPIDTNPGVESLGLDAKG